MVSGPFTRTLGFVDWRTAVIASGAIFEVPGREYAVLNSATSNPHPVTRTP